VISYPVYRLVHLLGIFLLFAVLGGLSYAASRGAAGAGTASEGARAGRSGISPRMAMALHGLALFIVLLGGFGLLARLGVTHGMDWPVWVWAKLGIWALAAAAVMVPRRKPEWAAGLFLTLPVLGGLAAWLAIFKPF
jgi:hypothetical protein